MTTFKYSLGQKVFDKWSDEFTTVIQKRVEYGRPYYRLENGSIRIEGQLYGEEDFIKPIETFKLSQI